MEAVESVENVYVAVVARKARNLKKKLEKISKFESQLNSGKVCILKLCFFEILRNNKIICCATFILCDRL